jgi:hypothetical protein
MVSEITISKGAYTVTIYSVEVTDNFTNKLFPITPPTGVSNQDAGPKDNKIVDLLRITQEINITQGYITGTDALTAKQVKDQLISMFKGADLKGGTCSITYDGDTLEGYIEKLAFTEKSSDEPTTAPTDFAKYVVQLNLIVGLPV